ncbi:hypothetical protein Tco_0958686, partial [Tanacetum coccineum]
DNDDKSDEWYYEIDAEEQRKWILEDEQHARLARKHAKKQRQHEEREERLARPTLVHCFGRVEQMFMYVQMNVPKVILLVFQVSKFVDSMLQLGFSHSGMG